jgi:HK97 family phage prohead protease
MSQLYYGTLSKRDDDKRIVEGIATSESIDASGEIIQMSAVKNALEGFMRHPALRVMHQLIAAGKVTKATLSSKGLYITAKVVDDDAWKKVKEGVLSGFSVGGKVTGRDPNNSKIITGIRLDEISLVDRPQNPDAVIDVIKAARKVPDAGGAVMTIDQMWLAHGKLLEAVGKMPAGPKRDAEKRDLDQMALDIVAATHRQRNAARLKILDEKSKLFPQPHEHPALS